jgi:hypothetical protein
MITKPEQKKRLAAAHAKVLADANECLRKMFATLDDDDVKIIAAFGSDVDYLPEDLQTRARQALSRVDHSALTDSQFDLILEAEDFDEELLASVDQELERFFSELDYLQD